VQETDARALAAAIYADLIGDEADPADVDAATVELLAHGDCSRVLHTVMFSDANLRRLVFDAFEQVHRRDPEPHEIEMHIESMRTQAVLPCDLPMVLLQAVVRQPAVTFGAGLAITYEIAHGRELTVAEMEHWAERTGFRDRPSLVRNLWMGPEALRHRVAGIYRAHLWRQPDPSGMATWSATLAKHGDEPVRSGLVSSLEYLLLARDRAAATLR
jgi:hypothetical protein